MDQYDEIKKKYQDCILFFRLGDFYEMFREDAKLVSKELDLVLTGKNNGPGDKVPMCGIPYHSYEQYAAKLVQKGYKLAICEQLSEPTSNPKEIVARDVVRIITPGTVIDDNMIDVSRNNFIMCIVKSKAKYAYAYVDITTGEFYCSESKTDDNESYIIDQINRVRPAQIICDDAVYKLSNELTKNFPEKFVFEKYYDWAFQKLNTERTLINQYNLVSLKGYDFNTPEMLSACGAVLTYLLETQKRDLKHLKFPKVINQDQFMYIDLSTRRNLEIEETMHEKSKYGSLLWVLDKTDTLGGKRALRSWLKQPLQDIDQIKYRLHITDMLVKNASVRTALKMQLCNVQDIERILGKLAYGNIMPKDCLALANSLDVLPDIKKILSHLNDEYVDDLSSKLIDMSEIVNTIQKTIAPDCPSLMKDGGYINKGVSPDLDYNREISTNSKNVILQMEADEKEKTGIKNLKISYNKVFGYYIEITNVNSDRVPFYYIRKQTIKNAERYITEDLKKLEEDIVTSHDKALKLESEIFATLKDYLMQYCSQIQIIATTLSFFDVLASFATIAVENNYCKPEMTVSSALNIKNGRHPVIEKMLKTNSFIANDTTLNDSTDRLIILTGPNMAGKSTYMRQIALITLMAHIGCFVPAESATIGIVDRIFTRIGASDDLSVGQSTFMVEMVEVANILHSATDKSLIILDEVGRGTSTFDGLSIAWSVVEYLTKNYKAKTLFATHFHELTELEGKLDGVKNYNIVIKEINGKLVFLRKIMRGSAVRSYGIEVASLAGLPDAIIDRSKDILQVLENQEQNTVKVTKAPQRHISKTESIIKDLDLNNMSPMLAFETLIQLKELCDKETIND